VTSLLLRTALAIAVVAPALAGCDTGDGKTLRPPAPGQTAPPTTITEGSLETVPISTPVPASGADGATVPVPPGAASDELAVFAPWEDGARIPRRYTCSGRDLSPPVSWIGAPEGTAEIAISLIDRTTAQGDDRGFVHWVVAGIDPTELTLVEGQVPAGSVQALNFFGDVGYGGPCPPPGETHEYVLTVHALASPTGLPDGTPALDLLDAIDAAAIDSRKVVGTTRGR
jgi:Raf kinase inhibitor-like YbhB/YbcL family protein